MFRSKAIANHNGNHSIGRILCIHFDSTLTIISPLSLFVFGISDALAMHPASMNTLSIVHYTVSCVVLVSIRLSAINTILRADKTGAVQTYTIEIMMWPGACCCSKSAPSATYNDCGPSVQCI